MLASVHIADVGIGTALKAVRKAPAPSEVSGLRNAHVGLGAPLGRRIAGFLPSPDIHRIAFYGFWDDDDALDRFIDEHPLMAAFAGGWQVRLAPLRMFGAWPGVPADTPKSRVTDHEGPVAVLTLGRFRLLRAPKFFNTSAKAERAVLGAPGLLWATGVAKPPFVSTCSLWESAESSMAYAFTHGQQHHDAIRVDRATPFHHQQAFIRFRPYASKGSLEGKNPLAERVLTPLTT